MDMDLGFYHSISKFHWLQSRDEPDSHVSPCLKAALNLEILTSVLSGVQMFHFSEEGKNTYSQSKLWNSLQVTVSCRPLHYLTEELGSASFSFSYETSFFILFWATDKRAAFSWVLYWKMIFGIWVPELWFSYYKKLREERMDFSLFLNST